MMKKEHYAARRLRSNSGAEQALVLLCMLVPLLGVFPPITWGAQQFHTTVGFSILVPQEGLFWEHHLLKDRMTRSKYNASR